MFLLGIQRFFFTKKKGCAGDRIRTCAGTKPQDIFPWHCQELVLSVACYYLATCSYGPSFGRLTRLQGFTNLSDTPASRKTHSRTYLNIFIAASLPPLPNLSSAHAENATCNTS